jgi:phospholipid/cholesterol/gamma-HCH transport system permease protein
MSETGFEVETIGATRFLRLTGPMLIADVAALRARIPDLPGSGPVILDLAKAGAMDTAGAWLLLSLRDRLEAEGVSVRIEGADARRSLLLETVGGAMPREGGPAARHGGFVAWVARFGEKTRNAGVVTFEMLGFAGEVMAAFLAVLVRPWRLRFTSLVHHMQDVGLNALPIVTLMAFLIGVVLAFMGSIQLRQFGAEVFVVDLIAITILRELGVLMAAIIVAGRTASAYTAAIGSMKLREEIDAMRTLGLDPIAVLVVPRILALVIMLPLLAFASNVAGLVGGALMAWIQLGVSPALFASRLTEGSDPWNFLVGMIQAPFFALIIGLVGCYEGLKVEKSAESLGARTSDSVVLAIFLVIVSTAAFSVFFMQLGV